MIRFSEKNGDLIFSVRVVPKSSRSEIVGEHGGALKIKIAAPPIDGAANEELVRVLSKQFGLGKNAVVILSGQTSKQKQVRVNGANGADLLKLL